MQPDERIKRAARAVAESLGGAAHRYESIVAVVLYADESVNNLDAWDYVTDLAAKAAAIEGADEIAERTRERAPKKRAA